MEQTPGVAQSLDVLIRDRDSAQRKFDEIRNKKMNAQIAKNLESENKSERFNLLEPPILPEKPFKPNRVKIIVLGFFLALGSSGGMLMALITFDRRVRGVDALAMCWVIAPWPSFLIWLFKRKKHAGNGMLRMAAIATISYDVCNFRSAIAVVQAVGRTVCEDAGWNFIGEGYGTH